MLRWRRSMPWCWISWFFALPNCRWVACLSCDSHDVPAKILTWALNANFGGEVIKRDVAGGIPSLSQTHLQRPVPPLLGPPKIPTLTGSTWQSLYTLPPKEYPQQPRSPVRGTIPRTNQISSTWLPQVCGERWLVDTASRRTSFKRRNIQCGYFVLEYQMSSHIHSENIHRYGKFPFTKNNINHNNVVNSIKAIIQNITRNGCDFILPKPGVFGFFKCTSSSSHRPLCPIIQSSTSGGTYPQPAKTPKSLSSKDPPGYLT